MLHLKFALSLEKLADEMIDEISRCWKDPFEAPVVIFPDPKLEQWFRLRWVQKKGVVANLNKSTIDRFLFNILAGDNESRQKLSADMLTNVILAYLMKQEDGTENYKKLDPEVTRYLCGDKGVLDENHLFDFASKMASLFLEYETSRPAGFAKNASGEAPGILDCWKQGALKSFFFKNEKSPREEWQKKLYSAIFHNQGKTGKSLLTTVFEKENTRKGQDGQGIEYLTIPYLYKECLLREAEGKPVFYDKALNGKPVFIFGLSGMGQFYRVILHKFASLYDVHAYIQNPCMEFWEDAPTNLQSVRRNWSVTENKWEDENIQKRMTVQLHETDTTDAEIDDIPEYNDNNPQGEENELLVNWGRSGRDNIKLWCQASNYDFDFKGSENEDIPQDTLLHKVQYAIAHRMDAEGIDEDALKDGSLTVTAAPTKIREIENLHTQICKLLQKGARVEDILVVSPCLDDYRTAISVVFDQTPAKVKTREEKGYLHIPFAIVDSPAKNSLTENALSSLFSILDQKTITRPNFFNLIRNPVVQAARGIQDDEVDAWQEWITETNTFRVRDNEDDWLKMVNRLLLAQMTSNDAPFDNAILRPYSNMASSNKASLCRFVDCIKSIEEWIDFGKSDSISDLEKLSEQLNNWIGMQKIPDSLKSETIVYRRVFDSIALLYCQISAGLSQISKSIVKQTLLLAAQGTEYSCGNIFVNGITFMKFVPNRTLPIKHLFFIGADAVSFPGAKQHNTLDLRKSCTPWPGDESPVTKNRYAFLCQFMSASEGFYLSYVNRDIKKDAELYPSSVINDLHKFIEKQGAAPKWKEIQISLDEKRDYEDLWTLKSLRNKIAYDRMMLGTKSETVEASLAEPPKSGLPKPQERVSFSSLAKFLYDPFEFRIQQMLKEDDEENPEKETFEPACFDNLDTSIILKKMLQASLSEEGAQEDVQNDLKLNGGMPVFEKEQWDNLQNLHHAVLGSMGPALTENIKSNWSFNAKIQDLSFESKGVRWTLTGSLDWCNSKDLKQVSQFIDITSSKDVKPNRWLTAYIKALALISIKDTQEASTIDVHFYCAKAAATAKDPSKSKPRKAAVTHTPKEAQEILEKIYDMAFIGEEGKVLSEAVPYALLNTYKEKLSDPNINKQDLIYDFRDDLKKGPWENFSKKNLFDPLCDVGFTRETFAEEWPKIEEKMISVTPQNKPSAR